MPYFLWEFDHCTRRKGVFGAAGTEAGPVGGSGHPTPFVRQRMICPPDEEGHPGVLASCARKPTLERTRECKALNLMNLV